MDSGKGCLLTSNSGSPILPSGSTFQISASPQFVSWSCTLWTFSSFGICDVSFLFVDGVPIAAHSMAADFRGAWFMWWIAKSSAV